MTWAEIWNAIKNFFTTSGVMVAKALLLFIVGYVVIRLALVLVKRILKRTKLDRVAQGFLLSGIKFVLYMILLIMVIQQFGVEITGIVAAFAAAGLAVSLALQNSLSNVASGIILLVTKPFKENDLIAVAGVEGKVQSIHILTTSLVTLDNKLVVLPNSTVAGNPITNYSNKKTRRVEFTFSVAYESNTELVKKVVLDVFKSNGKILLDPAPFCSIKTFNSSSIDFFCYAWADSEDYWDVYYYVYEHVFNEFKRNKISIPYSQVEVRMRDDKVVMPFDKTPLPERQEKVRKVKQKDKLDAFFDKLENADIKSKREQKKKEKQEKKQAKKLEKEAKKEEKK